MPLPRLAMRCLTLNLALLALCRRHVHKRAARSTAILLWTSIIWSAGAAFALNPNHRLTQFVHRIWQAQPGLPQSSIYAVTQSRSGFLWLGTESGIVRFDGVRFTP